MDTLQAFRFQDWLIIGATFLGPIMAVQAQKWIERARALSQRREAVFDVLMSTRGARVSAEHVNALNSIDLAFYGRRVFGQVIRGKLLQNVLDAWHEYHRHLTKEMRDKTKEDISQWSARGDELFLNLLQELALATHHKFDRIQLRNGGYTPIAHEEIELKQNFIRNLAIDVMSGQRSLLMNVTSFPFDTDAAAKEEQWRQDVLSRLGERPERS